MTKSPVSRLIFGWLLSRKKVRERVPHACLPSSIRICVVSARDDLHLFAAEQLQQNQAAYDQGHIPGAKLIPVGEVANRIAEFPRDKKIVTYCS